MTGAPVPISEAARTLNVDGATLRRWIRQGCPAIGGGPGRRKGSRVDLEAVRAWRDGRGAGVDLRQFPAFALDFWRRGREPDEPGHRVLGIPPARAAALLCLMLDYFRIRLQQDEIDTPEMQQLLAIAREDHRIGHTMPDLLTCHQPDERIADAELRGNERPADS